MREVVAFAIELADTGQMEPSLVVRGYRLVQQRALGVAWVELSNPSITGKIDLNSGPLMVSLESQDRL